jgi:hypothetical protein
VLSTLRPYTPPHEPISLDDSLSEFSESDTIEVDTHSVLSEHMPPPPLPYSQPARGRKRRQSQISISSTSTQRVDPYIGIESRVAVLKETIARKKKEKLQKIIQEEKRLQVELAELSS